MALQCNIDARGKRVRLLVGLSVLIFGIAILLFWSIPSNSRAAWVLSITAILAGVFMIFEARAGWCAVRAMGFKTRI